MNVLITSDCIYGKAHTPAGTLLDVTPSEASDLFIASCAIPAPDAPAATESTNESPAPKAKKKKV